MIKILKRRQIEIDKWDSVIASSSFENIYPYSWYLDYCADSWMGLVMNDYECVMPVAYRKKIGFRYVYQPYYCQQLGVYSSKPVDSEIVRMFLHKLGSIFNMGDYSFNAGNVLGTESGFDEKDSANYILSLTQSYDEIRENYSENCRRNLNKAYSNDIRIDMHVSMDDMLRLKALTEKSQHPNQKLQEFRHHLFSKLQALNKIEIIGARLGSHLVAAAVFVRSSKRITFLLSASSDAGKDKRGMFMVVDSFIQQNSESSFKLDFEGSNIGSIARFFRGFGAKPEIYQRVSVQNGPYKIMKRLRDG